MVVEDSGFKACTIVANPQEPSASIHLISHSATAFSPAFLDQLQKFLTNELQNTNTDPAEGNMKSTDVQIVDSNDLDAELDEEELALAQEIDIEADGDPAIRALQEGAFGSFFSL